MDEGSLTGVRKMSNLDVKACCELAGNPTNPQSLECFSIVNARVFKLLLL